MSPIRSATRRRWPASRTVRRLLPRAAVLGIVALLLTGCQSNAAWTRLGMRDPITTQGKLTLTLWQGSWVAALAVGVVVWGLILWAVIFHRKRSDQVPHQVRYNLPIEVMYTVIPFIMVGVLFYFTARDENTIDKLSAHCLQPKCVVVDVTGFQWSWEFQYPQWPVKNSSAGVTSVGEMWNGVIPGNRASLPLLEIPDHENVRFNLVSNDVIHSFWIIPFDFKRDVVPGHPNHFEVYPTSTLSYAKDGSLAIGRCSELCGLYHSRMLFQIRIVTPAQFRAWVSHEQRLQNASGGAQ